MMEELVLLEEFIKEALIDEARKKKKVSREIHETILLYC